MKVNANAVLRPAGQIALCEAIVWARATCEDRSSCTLDDLEGALSPRGFTTSFSTSTEQRPL